MLFAFVRPSPIRSHLGKTVHVCRCAFAFFLAGHRFEEIEARYADGDTPVTVKALKSRPDRSMYGRQGPVQVESQRASSVSSSK